MITSSIFFGFFVGFPSGGGGNPFFGRVKIWIIKDSYSSISVYFILDKKLFFNRSNLIICSKPYLTTWTFFVGFPSGGGGNPITNAGPGGFKAVKNDLIAEVRILFFKFSHNLSRFALTREDDTKISKAKSWAIVNIF